jgi:hypothetical protein
MRTLTKLGEAMSDRFPGPAEDDALPAEPGPDASQEIEEIAARLGITVKRVLAEAASLAFSDLSRIVQWAPGDEGLNIKLAEDIDPRDVAAIAEIVASASTGRIYRVKLHDKRGALSLLIRCLDMVPNKNARNQDQAADEDGQDPLDSIIREIDRRAAAGAVAAGTAEPGQGGATEGR